MCRNRTCRVGAAICHKPCRRVLLEPILDVTESGEEATKVRAAGVLWRWCFSRRCSIPHLTALANIQMSLRHAGLSAGETKALISSSAQFLKVDHLPRSQA